MRQAITLMAMLLLFTDFCSAQPDRADYFKDQVMRFTTVECWRKKKIDPKPAGITRLVFVGDSTTLGVGSSRDIMDFHYDYHFQLDGSKAGFKGFPYKLWQFLVDRNKTGKF